MSGIRSRLTLASTATACFFLVFLPALGSAALAESRTWTDKSGKHKIEAEFEKYEEGLVQLKTKDGKVLKISLGKLSKDDQQLVRELVKAGRAKAAAKQQEESAESQPTRRAPARPARPANKSLYAVGDRVEYGSGTKARPATVVSVEGSYVEIRYDDDPEGSTEKKPASWVKPLSKQTIQRASWSWEPPPMETAAAADLSEVRRIALNPSASNHLEADPAPDKDASEFGSIMLTDQFAYYEKLIGFEIALGEEPICVAAHSGGAEYRDITSRIEVVDLQESKLLHNYSGPAQLTSISLSPGGKMLITRSKKDDSSLPDHLDVWALGGDALQHVVSWQPYADGPERKRDVDSLYWVDDDRVLTRSNAGTYVLWQLDGVKAVYELPKSHVGVPSFSPGGKYFAIGVAKGIDFFETNTGKHLATMDVRDAAGQSMSFSPSGRLLALSGRQGVQVVDVTKGEKVSEFFIDGLRNCEWLDEQFLLTDKGLLVDSQKKFVAWRYKRNSLGKLNNRRYWYLTDASNNRSVVNLALPHEAARTAAANVDVQDVFAVQPGTTVALDVQVGSGEVQQQAEDRLRKAATTAGLKVEDGAQTRLSASTRTGKSEEMRYRRIGAGTGNGDRETTMNIASRIYDVKLTSNGQEIWSRTSLQTPPYMPRIEGEESIQQAVSREMAVNADYLPSYVPSYIVKPSYQKPRGESQLTERGVEDL